MVRSVCASPGRGNQCPRCGVGHTPPTAPRCFTHTSAAKAGRAGSAGASSGVGGRQVKGSTSAAVLLLLVVAAPARGVVAAVARRRR